MTIQFFKLLIREMNTACGDCVISALLSRSEALENVLSTHKATFCQRTVT